MNRLPIVYLRILQHCVVEVFHDVVTKVDFVAADPFPAIDPLLQLFFIQLTGAALVGVVLQQVLLH